MPTLENASVFQGIQLGAESLSTPGTAVSASKRLRGLGITKLTPKPNIKGFRPYGSKADSVVLLGKEMSVGAYEGILDPRSFLYVLASCCANPVISTPTGATNTRRWVFTMLNDTPDALRTYTMEKGSDAGATRFPNGIFNSLALMTDQDGNKINGNIVAGYETEGLEIYGNEVQTITVDGTGGTFTVTFGGQTTAATAFNATAAVLQANLEALSTIGSGNILVTGGPGAAGGGTAYRLQFIGTLRGTNVAACTTGVGSLTGGAGTATVVTATGGATVTDVNAEPLSSKPVWVLMNDTFATLPTSPNGGSPNLLVTGSGDASQLTRLLGFKVAIPDRKVPLFTVDGSQSGPTAYIEKALGEGLTAQLEVMQNTDAETLMTKLRAGTKRYLRASYQGSLIETNFYHGIQIDMAGRFRDTDRGDKNDVYAGTYDFDLEYDSTLGAAIKITVDTDVTAL